MMKTEELRIGNYFNVPRLDQSPFRIDEIETLTDKYAKVGMNVFQYECPITKQMIWGHPLTWELKDLYGIPLTVELLLKCGAIRVPHKVFTNSFELALKRNKKIIISDIGTPNFMMGIVECHFETGQVEDVVNIHNWDFEKDMYLHQLQNLYFALTGKEMEVNL